MVMPLSDKLHTIHFCTKKFTGKIVKDKLQNVCTMQVYNRYFYVRVYGMCVFSQPVQIFIYQAQTSSKNLIMLLDFRIKLREELQCHNLRWYLKTIYLESQMPLNFTHLGEIRHISGRHKLKPLDFSITVLKLRDKIGGKIE